MFDRVVHSQALYSLSELGFNPYCFSFKILVSQTYVRLKSNGQVFVNVPVSRGVRQEFLHIFSVPVCLVFFRIYPLPVMLFFGGVLPWIR